MAEPLASVDDFKVWPGIVVDDEQEPAAVAVLVAASSYVRAAGQPWPDPATVPDAVKTVVVQVAARVWRNPTAARMIVTGPFTEQFYSAVDDSLYLTPIERNTIARAASRPRVWTMATTRDGDGCYPAGYDCFSGEFVPPSPYPPGEFLLGGAP